MAEKYRLWQIKPGVQRVVVCRDCQRVVAEDRGGWGDWALVLWAVSNHVGHPRTTLTVEQRHRLETVDAKTGASRDGLHFDSCLKH